MKGKALAGGSKFGGAKAPFESYSANLTSDKETGLGNWTDAQIVLAIREGVRPDGSIVGVPMPTELYRHLSDRDVNAIVAYLRSLPPIEHKVPENVPPGAETDELFVHVGVYRSRQ